MYDVNARYNSEDKWVYIKYKKMWMYSKSLKSWCSKNPQAATDNAVLLGYDTGQVVPNIPRNNLPSSSKVVSQNPCRWMYSAPSKHHKCLKVTWLNNLIQSKSAEWWQHEHKCNIICQKDRTLNHTTLKICSNNTKWNFSPNIPQYVLLWQSPQQDQLNCSTVSSHFLPPHMADSYR